jgi:hypothetical protein
MTKKQKIRYQQWLNEYRQSMMRHFTWRMRERINLGLSEAEYWELNNEFVNPRWIGLHEAYSRLNITIEMLDKRGQIGFKTKKNVWYKIRLAIKGHTTVECWVLYKNEYRQLVTVVEPEADPVCPNTFMECSRESDWENNWKDF